MITAEQAATRGSSADPEPRGRGDARRRQTVVRALIVGVVAITAGVAVVVSPVSLGVIAGAVAATWLLAIGRRAISVFHGALIALLIGYAFMGKGFAYFGVPPLYVGEICLALGLVAILHAWRQATFSWPMLFLLLFMAWGLVRTVPYLPSDGLLAIRDAVTWGYGVFAIAVALTVQREHLDRIVSIYRRGASVLVWWFPLLVLMTLLAASSLPRFPGSPVPVAFFKAGDAGVQLAGIAAFVLLGLYSAGDTTPVRQVVLWTGWFVSAAFAALSRGALLAMLTAGACVLFVVSIPRLVALGFVVATFAVLLATINPEVDLGLGRTVSVGQLVDNLTNIAGNDDPQLAASKDWRLAWWGKIYGYTVDGPYFWDGRGFGINLASADGFQVDAEESLRAPHSVHLEILARAGVPGLVLWFAFLLAFASTVLRAAAVARRIGEPMWVPLLGWVFVYWLASVVNGSFDVYIGGPQGGIWFWSMIGLGLALARMVDERASRRSEPSAVNASSGQQLGPVSERKLEPVRSPDPELPIDTPSFSTGPGTRPQRRRRR